MNPLSTLLVLRWLVRDTFRQALHSGVFWLLLAVSVICVALCLTTTVIETPDDSGRLELAFGAIQVPLDRGRAAAVRTLEVFLAGWVADALGLLLALMGTAGFLPSFLEAGSASVLLAKPVPRWGLLAGKCAGIVTFVAVQDGFFLAGTWLALGLRTGVWDAAYLLCLPVLLLHFAVFFSFSAMLATATRSTVACMFGSILFWLLCWAMNLGRHWFVLVPDLHNAAAGLGHTIELGYWLLPKPLDCHLLLLGTLPDDPLLSRVLDMHALAARGGWRPAASVLASCISALVLLAVAAYDFVTADY
ncbi:MAG TPA: ABC transporter permease subunit [Gemmataceae bacterium]|jgi:ABC-type transport system involved in multi-copper enzyme maturation permease subunit